MKIIPVQVSGDRTSLSNRDAGAAGGYRSAALQFVFDSGWSGIHQKRVTFVNPKEEPPVYAILDENGQAFIPTEALKYSGIVTFSVAGFVYEGEALVQKIVTVQDYFLVSLSCDGGAPAAAVPDDALASLQALIQTADERSEQAVATATSAAAGASSALSVAQGKQDALGYDPKTYTNNSRGGLQLIASGHIAQDVSIIDITREQDGVTDLALTDVVIELDALNGVGTNLSTTCNVLLRVNNISTSNFYYTTATPSAAWLVYGGCLAAHILYDLRLRGYSYTDEEQNVYKYYNINGFVNSICNYGNGQPPGTLNGNTTRLSTMVYEEEVINRLTFYVSSGGDNKFKPGTLYRIYGRRA